MISQAALRQMTTPKLSLQLLLLGVGALLVIATAVIIFPIMFTQSAKAVDEAVSVVLSKTGISIAQNIQAYYQVAYIPVENLRRQFELESHQHRLQVGTYAFDNNTVRVQRALWNLVAAIPNLRWLYLTTKEGWWIAYERVIVPNTPPAYNYMIHHIGANTTANSLAYDYFPADPVYGDADIAGNACPDDSCVANGTECCGFVGTGNYTRGHAQWGALFLWTNQYLVGWNSPYYNFEGQWGGTISCEFGFLYLGRFLATQVDKPSEQVTIIDATQTVNKGNFVASSNPNIPDAKPDPSTNGTTYLPYTMSELSSMDSTIAAVWSTVQSQNMLTRGDDKWTYQDKVTINDAPHYIYCAPVIERQLRLLLCDTVKVSDYMQKIDDGNRLTIILVCCIGFALMLGMALLLFVLMSPLRALIDDMDGAKNMDFEALHGRTSLSKLREVFLLQQAFFMLVLKLVEYKSYLPQSMFDTGDDEEDEADVKSASGVVRAGDAASTQPQAVRATASEVHDSSTVSSKMSKQVSSRGSVRNTRKKVQGSNTALGVQTKVVSILACNVSGFNDFVSQPSESKSFVKSYSEYVTITNTLVQNSKGTLDRLSGDRLWASFNAGKAVSNHKVASTKCAIEIRKAFGTSDVVQNGKWSIGIGLCSGKVLAGNLGGDGARSFMLVGNTVVCTTALADIATSARCHPGVLIMCDDKIGSEISLNYNVLICGRVVLQKVGSDRRGFIVYRVDGEKKREDDEWMYQLESDHADPYSVLNTAVTTILEGKPLEPTTIPPMFLAQHQEDDPVDLLIPLIKSTLDMPSTLAGAKKKKITFEVQHAHGLLSPVKENL